MGRWSLQDLYDIALNIREPTQNVEEGMKTWNKWGTALKKKERACIWRLNLSFIYISVALTLASLVVNLKDLKRTTCEVEFWSHFTFGLLHYITTEMLIRRSSGSLLIHAYCLSKKSWVVTKKISSFHSESQSSICYGLSTLWDSCTISSIFLRLNAWDVSLHATRPNNNGSQCNKLVKVSLSVSVSWPKTLSMVIWPT